jgi:hypothetical protein
LEKHYRRLKSKLGKTNLSTEKKYEMEDEEAYDDFRLCEENKNTIGEIYHQLKTDQFTLSDEAKKIKLDISSSSGGEDIVDKYNKIVFFNEENLLKRTGSELTDFSGISPLLTYNKSKKKKISKKFIKTGKDCFVRRIDSFTLPRTTSKIKMYKFK